MQTQGQLQSNGDELIALVKELRGKIETQGLPDNIVNAARVLESLIIEFVEKGQSLLVVNSAYNELVAALRKFIGHPEWKKDFTIGIIIKLLVRILEVLIFN